MKIKGTLHVSAEAYFNTLQKYLLKDLRKSVDRSIKMGDLKAGYTFTKTYQRKNDSDYVSHQEIVEMDYGKAYCLKFSVPGGYQVISHHIKELDENTIEVVYEEVIESKEFGLNVKQFMRRNKSRKLMKQILANLEKEIQIKSA